MATLGGKMYLIPMHWAAAVAGKVGGGRHCEQADTLSRFVFMYATLDCDTFAFLR